MLSVVALIVFAAAVGYFFGYDIGFERGVDVPASAEPVEYKDLVRVTYPLENELVTSPLRITGEARGPWYFEATFPLVVVDWDGRIIGQHYAEAQGEWMTEDFVPFVGTVTFDADTSVSNRGAVILQKSNASGLPEHDDAVEIPVRFR